MPRTAWGRGCHERLGRDATGVGLVGLIKRLGAKDTRNSGCQEWIIVLPSPCYCPGPKDVSIADWIASLASRVPYQTERIPVLLLTIDAQATQRTA